MSRIPFLFGAALGLLTLSTTPAFAQASKVRTERAHKSPDQRAAATTQRMTTQLTLTPDQQAKVSALNTQLASDLSALHKDSQAEKAVKRERRAKAEALRAAYATNLKATLTPEQYSRHEKQLAERDQKQHARHDARRATRGKNSKGSPSVAPAQPMLGPGPAQN